MNLNVIGSQASTREKHNYMYSGCNKFKRWSWGNDGNSYPLQAEVSIGLTVLEKKLILPRKVVCIHSKNSAVLPYSVYPRHSSTSAPKCAWKHEYVNKTLEKQRTSTEKWINKLAYFHKVEWSPTPEMNVINLFL